MSSHLNLHHVDHKSVIPSELIHADLAIYACHKCGILMLCDIHRCFTQDTAKFSHQSKNSYVFPKIFCLFREMMEINLV